MNIGVAAGDLLYALLAVPVGMLAIGLLLLLSRLVARLLGLRSGLLTLLLFILGLFALGYGGSLALDAAGQPTPGRVAARTETVQLRRAGDWQRQLSVTVTYTAAAQDASAQLRVAPQQFDALGEGDAVELRVLPIYRSLALIRLASTSTRDLIPLSWLLYGVAAIGLFVCLRLLARTAAGAWLAVGVGLVAALGVPVWLTYADWVAQSDIAGRTQRAEATVVDVTRVTQIDYFPCRGNCRSTRNTEFDAILPYDIVRLRFTPPAARGPVTAVTTADAGTLQNLAPGASMTVSYAPEDPRAPLIPGTRHDHVWQNAVYFVAIYGGVLVLGVAVLWLVSRRAARRRTAAVSTAQPK